MVDVDWLYRTRGAEHSYYYDRNLAKQLDVALTRPGLDGG